jgi:hypothetical protein
MKSKEEIQPELRQSDIVWHDAENSTATSSAMHAYYARESRDHFYSDPYNGVSALCSKKRMISEDGETSVNINDLEKHELRPEYACKKCQLIFRKLKP